MLRSTDAHSGRPLLDASGDSDDDERGRSRSYRSNRASPVPSTSSQLPAHLQHRLPTHSADPPDARPTLSRRSTMRSRSPATNTRLEAKKKYTYAAFFLLVSLVTFTAQTELASHVQGELGWNKAYCMLYLTHGSWVLLWPLQLVYLRLRRREQPWQQFWKNHVWLLRTTAQMVELQERDIPRGLAARSPWPYMLRTTALVTTSLTVAGGSWYLAVSMTTPSDLTAIYNCSAFFAYAFSVPLLKEKLRWDKVLAVGVAIVGVLVVAYGDGKGGAGDTPAASTRFLGNIVIGVGSVLYGLYEVLYKRLACPPSGTSAGRTTIFANTFGSFIGFFTLFVLWIPLPLLHILGWEKFELPTGWTAYLLFLSVIMNMLFAGSFLVLISLTSPVLSSVAALLTIFTVAIFDWWWTGVPLTGAALFGGLLIIVAFGMLSWSTWREMVEEEAHKRHRAATDISDEDDVDSDKD